MSKHMSLVDAYLDRASAVIAATERKSVPAMQEERGDSSDICPRYGGPMGECKCPNCRMRRISMTNETPKSYYIDPETKVRYVRDAAYWGVPAGTPITPGMKPRSARSVAKPAKRAVRKAKPAAKRPAKKPRKPTRAEVRAVLMESPFHLLRAWRANEVRDFNRISKKAKKGKATKEEEKRQKEYASRVRLIDGVMKERGMPALPKVAGIHRGVKPKVKLKRSDDPKIREKRAKNKARAKKIAAAAAVGATAGIGRTIGTQAGQRILEAMNIDDLIRTIPSLVLKSDPYKESDMSRATELVDDYLIKVSSVIDEIESKQSGQVMMGSELREGMTIMLDGKRTTLLRFGYTQFAADGGEMWMVDAHVGEANKDSEVEIHSERSYEVVKGSGAEHVHAKTWYIDPETKVRKVRDSDFWGMPVGTPITPGMKPKGKKRVGGAAKRVAKASKTGPKKRVAVKKGAKKAGPKSKSPQASRKGKYDGLAEEVGLDAASKYGTSNWDSFVRYHADRWSENAEYSNGKYKRDVATEKELADIEAALARVAKRVIKEDESGDKARQEKNKDHILPEGTKPRKGMLVAVMDGEELRVVRADSVRDGKVTGPTVDDGEPLYFEDGVEPAKLSDVTRSRKKPSGKEPSKEAGPDTSVRKADEFSVKGAADELGKINPDGRKEGTGTLEDPIDCGSDVQKAHKLLAEGKHIRLDSPMQVSILMDRLAGEAAFAKERGIETPDYDLCKVTVPGTNLFCLESKGIPRAKMPQFSGRPVEGSYAETKYDEKKGESDVMAEFGELLDSMGIAVEEKRVSAVELKATQSQLVGTKVSGMRQAMREGKVKEDAIYVTRDGYIVDGHHRWAAQLGLDLEDGTLGDVDMPVRMIDAEIGYIIDLANGFTEMAGIKPKSTGAAAEGVKSFLEVVFGEYRPWKPCEGCEGHVY